tara:strand:+ start:1269 stop:1637 length:369 start_codon:yes stop_codon:yes gene_type:complete
MKNKYIIYRLGDEGKYNQVDWVIHTEGDDDGFEIELRLTIEGVAFDKDIERMDNEDFFFFDEIDVEHIKKSIYTVIETEYGVTGDYDFWYIVREKATASDILKHLQTEKEINNELYSIKRHI